MCAASVMMTKPFTCGRSVLQLLEERHEGEVGEDPLILGVVDDVGELVGEESRVQRVDDAAARP